MRLEQINDLRELDRHELIEKARDLGVDVEIGAPTSTFPTADSLRLLIIEKTIEKEAEPSAPTRAELAGKFEESAINILAAGGDPTQPQPNIADVLGAHVAATLALGQRVAELTDRLGDYLGDDSSLDRLQQALHDPTSGKRVAEILLGHLPGRVA